MARRGSRAKALNIVGIGEAQSDEAGERVAFILETANGGSLRLTCTTTGLEVFIATLTGLHQAAMSKRLTGPSDAKQIEIMPVSQIGCGTDENSLDVIVSAAIASGTSLNLSLRPELARDLAKVLADAAATQIRKKN